MSVYEQLNQALSEREKQEITFYSSIINEIYKIIEDLESCDTSNDPHIGDSLTLSAEDLNRLTTKIKSDMNETQMAQDIANQFDAKAKELQLRKVARVATPNTPAPSLWNRMVGSRPVAPVAPAPVAAPAAPAAPAPTFWDRILGQRPRDRTDSSRAQWENYAQHPNSVPSATPVYQAEAYYSNPYGKGGTRRKHKRRKSRRKV